MAPVDLNEVVERSLMLVRHHLEISQVKLHCDQQALVALLVNAVEAMKGLEGQDADLNVRLRGDNDEVQIDIGDAGVGIPPDVLPQIFDPFFSTKEQENGVGLGLAVVYGIVRRHGGQISVESKVGQGTVFHLRLPRQPKPAAETISDRSEGGEQGAP
jgi:signal transduction histidine kinase